MSSRPLRFTDHAEDMLAERMIKREWVERTVAAPTEIEPDVKHPGVKIAFRAIEENGNRVLRVAYAESEQEVRIVTVYFDRGRRKAWARKK